MCNIRLRAVRLNVTILFIHRIGERKLNGAMSIFKAVVWWEQKGAVLHLCKCLNPKLHYSVAVTIPSEDFSTIRTVSLGN